MVGSGSYGDANTWSDPVATGTCRVQRRMPEVQPDLERETRMRYRCFSPRAWKLRSAGVFAVLMCFSPILIFGQFPGGVGGAVCWVRCSEVDGDSVVMECVNNADTVIHLATGGRGERVTWSNHHPIVSVPAEQRVIALNAPRLKHLTTISVQRRPRQGEDRLSWSLSRADTGFFVQTARRVGRLSDRSFIDLADNDPGALQLSIYCHGDDATPEGPYSLQLAGSTSYPDLTVLGVQDTVVEVLLYDRVLSAQERMRVATALAIKYGLTLYGVPYLSSQGEMLWNNEVDGKFGSNMIGIGHDVQAAMDQRASTSSNEPGFMVFSSGPFNTWNDEAPQMTDGQFILIGDDGGERRWLEREPVQPQYLERTWLVRRTGPELSGSELRMARGALTDAPDLIGSVWLVIDRSGEGDFREANVAYHRCVPGATSGPQYIFTGLDWDTDGSGSDVFKLAAGGSFIPKFWVDPPVCSTGTGATVHLGVAGGEGEVRIAIRQIDGAFERSFVVEDDSVRTISDVPQGEFQVEITDGTGYRLDDRIWIQAIDAPVLNLQASYILDPARPLLLDAGEQVIGATYEWQCDGSVISHDRVLDVDRTGSFQCTVDSDGCLARRSFEVITPSEDGYFQVAAVPNPVVDGRTRVSIAFKHATSVYMMVVDSHGSVIQSRDLSGASFYGVDLDLRISGVYLLNVKSAQGSRSIRLVVP